MTTWVEKKLYSLPLSGQREEGQSARSILKGLSWKRINMHIPALTLPECIHVEHAMPIGTLEPRHTWMTEVTRLVTSTQCWPVQRCLSQRSQAPSTEKHNSASAKGRQASHISWPVHRPSDPVNRHMRLLPTAWGNSADPGIKRICSL